MAKKYFWLKLKEDFFDKRVIKKLRKIAGGDTYTIIYLKLQLLAMKNDGKLFFEGVEENFAEEMALELDEDAENVKVTLMYLEKNNLIETLSENEFLLPEVIESTGSESSAAARVRKHRENKKALQCNTDVTECNKNVTLEKEIDKDIDIDDDRLNNKYIDYKKTLADEMITEIKKIIPNQPTNQVEIILMSVFSQMIKSVNHFGKEKVIKALKYITGNDYLKTSANRNPGLFFKKFFDIENIYKIQAGTYEEHEKKEMLNLKTDEQIAKEYDFSEFDNG